MRKLIKIEGMTCGHCSARVEKNLAQVDGVEEVVIDLEAKNAIVTLGKAVNNETIVEAIDDAGYDVIDISEA
ncbi:heavy-metal-associated domain-containing protein [Tindallia californiensis]|uniref:Copper chaperone CopZ n=1 Tax=Tindallia californiensis TaxID=159292 RepID=A0A1H3MAP0_9FIRM|nr:heavy metal-associated domain-containing protein [Tindallia californiensis]SDY73802.1 Cu2+-exporting ATPase/Cu+-exporting ATPase [Tindallia californiensis]